MRKALYLTLESISDGYKVTLAFDLYKIDLQLDLSDVSLDDMIAFANTILEDFVSFETKAKTAIVNDFLENYNENWADEEEGYPELTEEAFKNNLEVTAIHFYSKDLIDVFYTETGMFGNHYLVAHSHDGKHFKDTTMFG
ncbi:DUF2262 domain-containing protein [Formosa sp. 3Alg 14/1]|uniref:DUF2262 domain-containing protein n=1 Tax=Formosa sp. 3Alg 14/1 TaxID=3382190 RepID=UPI0039BE2BEB